MASPTLSTPQNQDYNVGWICALPLEMAAAKAMLDEIYGPPRRQHAHDTNNYCLGRIGDHNIVIACLPGGVYGTNSAAIVAERMQLSFKSIKFGLMVGIGGGAPSSMNDIRLGDVVVSKPGSSSGVIQFDYGKRLGQDQFAITGSLNKPPLIVLTAISHLMSNHMMEDSKIPL